MTTIGTLGSTASAVLKRSDSAEDLTDAGKLTLNFGTEGREVSFTVGENSIQGSTITSKFENPVTVNIPSNLTDTTAVGFTLNGMTVTGDLPKDTAEFRIHTGVTEDGGPTVILNITAHTLAAEPSPSSFSMRSLASAVPLVGRFVAKPTDTQSTGVSNAASATVTFADAFKVQEETEEAIETSTTEENSAIASAKDDQEASKAEDTTNSLPVPTDDTKLAADGTKLATGTEAEAPVANATVEEAVEEALADATKTNE